MAAAADKENASLPNNKKRVIGNKPQCQRMTGDGELTDGLRGNQVTKERGEHDEDHGISNPGQVLEEHVAFQLPVHPLIG